LGDTDRENVGVVVGTVCEEEELDATVCEEEEELDGIVCEVEELDDDSR
jgi:hypothetical protein